MAKHYKKIKKSLLVKLIIIILIIVIISGIGYIIFKLCNSHKEEENYEKLAEYIQNDGYTNNQKNEEISQEKTERMLKLNELHKQNEDIVAWIEIPNSNISYPVLQSNDNDYYLNRNYQKQYSEIGSIFLDKDVDLNKPSSNFLMYGHRTNNGTMFEDLYEYRKEDFYNTHKKIKFTTLNEDAEFEVLAVFYSRVYYKYETNVFRYYFFINAETEKEYNDYVSNAKKVSIYNTGVNAEYGDQLITLSTCEYSQEDGRFVVVAKKIK